jgi:Xaa-Pro aminopeptidase
MGKEEPIVGVSISQKELQRRWGAVREAMKDAQLDFLIMQNFTDFLGGYVKWFTDMSARHNYQFTLIFPRDDDMITIKHGARRTIESGPYGIKKQIGVPGLPSLGFSSTFDAEAVVSELAKYRDAHIGLVGLGSITANFYNYITKHLDTVKFTDATDLVDKIKAIKSDEEIHHIRNTCAMQDATFAYAMTVVKPGRRSFEIYADIMHQCMQTGSEQINLAVGSAPAGTATKGTQINNGGRIIQDGDQVSFLIESNGPSGLFAEIMRTVCLGKVPTELQHQYEVAQRAQRITLELLTPGADPMTIWNANNDFLRSEGFPEEKRLLSHGMGYDMVERPSVQIGETMKIQAGMNIAAHATVNSERAVGAVCENYLITEKGNVCLHKTQQKIFVI